MTFNLSCKSTVMAAQTFAQVGPATNANYCVPQVKKHHSDHTVHRCLLCIEGRSVQPTSSGNSNSRRIKREKTKQSSQVRNLYSPFRREVRCLRSFGFSELSLSKGCGEAQKFPPRLVWSYKLCVFGVCAEGALLRLPKLLVLLGDCWLWLVECWS